MRQRSSERRHAIRSISLNQSPLKRWHVDSSKIDNAKCNFADKPPLSTVLRLLWASVLRRETANSSVELLKEVRGIWTDRTYQEDPYKAGDELQFLPLVPISVVLELRGATPLES